MIMTDRRYDRRTVLKSALAGLAALPAAGLIREAAAQGATPPHLDEKDSLAVAMGYVHDVKKVDATKNPQFKPGAKCANCLQLTGKEGDAWRPCNIFPGKLVNANGWCRVWVQKPGTKLG
jgi:high potential iron-sulfur protein